MVLAFGTYGCDSGVSMQTYEKNISDKLVKKKLPTAVLIVGPSGSGKTPLGNYLEEKGFGGKRWVHFDFGANLRKVASDENKSDILTNKDMAIIIQALKAGALLEDQNFYIAHRILDSFINSKKLADNNIIVLNGLPRHVGQAEAIDKLVNISMVIFLDCMPGVLSERIKENSGGDRNERLDDTPGMLACKLRIFQTRTIPLLNYYRRRGIKIVSVKVYIKTTPEDIFTQIKEYIHDFEN